MISDGTFRAFKAVHQADWDGNLLRGYREEVGEICNAPPNSIIVLPCRENLDSRYKTIRKEINKLGWKDVLTDQKKHPGAIVGMTEGQED